MMAVPEKCPECGSTYIWRSPRRLLERVFSRRAFVCHGCGKRILQHRSRRGKTAL